MESGDFAAGRGFNPAMLDHYADTPAGRAWLRKYLHPPGTPVAEVSGLPDRESMTTACMEWTLQNTIDPPPNPGGTLSSWNVAFWTLPNIRNLVYGIKWPSGSDPETDGTDFFFQNTRIGGWDVSTAPIQLIDRLRPIARSETVELNAAALADQGMAYCCSIRGQNGILPDTTGTAPTVVFQDVGVLPVNGGDVTMASSKSYTGRAVAGDYNPHSLTQPTVLFLGSGDNTGGVGNPLQAYRNRIQFVYPSGTTTQFLFPGYSTPWDQMSVGVHLFTGLSFSATLEIKIVLAYEVVPALNSVWLPFQTPGATPDARAVDNAYVIRHAMPDAFPASANFWGALASLAGSFLPKLLPALGGMAASGISGWLNKKAKPKPQAGAMAFPGITPIGRIANRRARRRGGGQQAALRALVDSIDAVQPLPFRSPAAKKRRNQRRRQRRKAKRSGVAGKTEDTAFAVANLLSRLRV